MNVRQDCLTGHAQAPRCRGLGLQLVTEKCELSAVSPSALPQGSEQGEVNQVNVIRSISFRSCSD